MKVDKSDWKMVKLKDILSKKEENDRENAKNRFDRFLKVEHMDAESLHIKRWSSQEQGEELNPYFYKIFRKGQILFPTRNPHLRRTALASFDGVTGEKTLTLEIDKEFTEPKFIPFLFHSESFYNHSTNAIIGSTNPHVRWRDVADYEFLLPSIDEQVQFGNLFWAVDEVVEKQKRTLEKLKRIDLSLLKHFFYEDKSSQRIKLKKIIQTKKGKKPPKLDNSGDGLPYCTANYLRTNNREFNVPKEAWGKSVLVKANDILILWDGSNAGEMLWGKEGVLASTMCKLNVIDNDFLKDFVFHFLRFKTTDIKRATVGSAIPHVDPGMIENIEIPKIEISKQKEIINLFSVLNESVNKIESQIADSKNLQKTLINKIF